MKNIHVLPTDKPSTICKNNNVLVLSKIGIITNNTKSLICQNIYITSDEEIKEGVNEWYLDKFINKPRNSSGSQYSEKQDVIILTSDQDLIKDGVQSIDDDFLEWFVKNPSCEEVETVFNNRGITGAEKILKTFGEYKIIIPKEEPKQENCCTPVGQIKRYLNCVGCDRKPKQETLEHTSKFIAFTLQDSESWIQHSIPLDSFEKADNFCQQFRDRKMSYLICKTLKQGYNGK